MNVHIQVLKYERFDLGCTLKIFLFLCTFFERYHNRLWSRTAFRYRVWRVWAMIWFVVSPKVLRLTVLSNSALFWASWGACVLREVIFRWDLKAVKAYNLRKSRFWKQLHVLLRKVASHVCVITYQLLARQLKLGCTLRFWAPGTDLWAKKRLQNWTFNFKAPLGQREMTRWCSDLGNCFYSMHEFQNCCQMACQACERSKIWQGKNICGTTDCKNKAALFSSRKSDFLGFSFPMS